MLRALGTVIRMSCSMESGIKPLEAGCHVEGFSRYEIERAV